MPYFIYVIIAIIAFIGGWWFKKQQALTKANSAELRAEKLISETKTKERQIIIEAQDKALKIVDQAKKDADAQRHETNQTQKRLEQRENTFSHKLH